MSESENNPYAAPTTSPELEQPAEPVRFQLASRWARLGAALLDITIQVSIVYAVMFILGTASVYNEAVSSSLGGFQASDMDLFTSLVSILIVVVTYLAVNGYLMVKRGQTIGKMALGIQVVCYRKRQLVSAGRIIGVRYLLTILIGNIPAIGRLFNFIDIIAIFGAEKRCLHDLMADTLVVKKTPRNI
ncbi:MAG: RDD family protein [Akkermansiaceae bacterium]